MGHELGFTQIAIVIVATLIGGLLFARFKQPAILGYILTGILLGPSGLALIESRNQVESLAELGVLLLLFVIGMELNLRLLKRVWPVAVLCTLLQALFSIGISWCLGWFFAWSTGMVALIGFVTALSSTAVVFKMLDTIGELKSETGQLTIGVLIAQDLAIVPMILILRNLQEATSMASMLMVKVLISIGLTVALTVYLSQRQRIHVPLTRLISGEKELIPIVSLTFCFGAAAISGLIGLSAAYGSFLAGLILGNTHERLVLLETTKPIQSTLLMVFFLSIGLLLDLTFLWAHLGTVLLLLLVITLGKTAINVCILHLLRLPWSQAFLIGVVLAQLGEFAFLLATVSSESGIINSFGYKLIISLTVLSLMLSPLWLAYARHLKRTAGGHWVDLKTILATTHGRQIQWFKRRWRILTGRTGFFAKTPPDYSRSSELLPPDDNNEP